jgi:uncharacterized membrane protein
MDPLPANVNPAPTQPPKGWLARIWEWIKANRKWFVLPALVAGALWLVRALGGSPLTWIRGKLGKEPAPTPPPGTMTHKEADRAKENLAEAYAEKQEAAKDARAKEHAADDAWLKGGGK